MGPSTGAIGTPSHLCTTIAKVHPSILHKRMREWLPLSNDMEIHPLPTCATVTEASPAGTGGERGGGKKEKECGS